MTVWGTKVTKKKIEQLSRALFPKYGIKDVASLVATISKYRNNDGHVKIWRPEGGWSWFASPGMTTATPSMVTLKFPADYQRTAEQARDDLFRQLEDATLGVMSEDEMEAAVARGATAPVSHATKKSPAQLQREINEALRRRAMALSPAQVAREITEGFAKRHAREETLSPAQRAYISAVEEDVRLFPTAYKADVRADPTAWALRHIDGLSDADVRRLAREQRAETKRTSRATGR